MAASIRNIKAKEFKDWCIHNSLKYTCVKKRSRLFIKRDIQYTTTMNKNTRIVFELRDIQSVVFNNPFTPLHAKKPKKDKPPYIKLTIETYRETDDGHCNIAIRYW